MLMEHEGRIPRIAESAWVAPTAVVCGDVAIGERCRVLHGAVLVDDGGPVELGEQVIVMEQAVVRAREGHPVRVGRHTLIGPHAHVNGAEIEEACFVATGTSLFPGARLGARSILAIEAIVHVNSVVPPDTHVPIGWIAGGDPAQYFSPDNHHERWEVQQKLNFPETMFGLERPTDAESRAAYQAEATRQYAELFGRHRGDRVL
jgi:carbonic anhydrase/acetyltransferase-like protein (isoleucine patch superfamily)